MENEQYNSEPKKLAQERNKKDNFLKFSKQTQLET
jgi:hypothetical protein